MLLRGTLQFRAQYEDSSNRTLELKDEYQVDIRIDTDNIPHVRETGGRLDAPDRIARLGKKDIMDMHIYPKTKEVCLGTIPNMLKIYSEDPTIKGIFYNLIIRYFYYHTYWEQIGVEPWPGLPHGFFGILKEYARLRGSVNPRLYAPHLTPAILCMLNSNKRLGKNRTCFCPKARKAKHCDCGTIDIYNLLCEDYQSA